MSIENDPNSSVTECRGFDERVATAYLAGSLPYAEFRAFEDHVASCDHCRAELEMLDAQAAGANPYGPAAVDEPATGRPRFTRRRAATLAGRAGAALLGLAIVGGAAVFLGLTVRSQIRAVKPEAVPYSAGGRAAGAPAFPRPGMASSPAAPAPSPSGGDEDGDGIDDGIGGSTGGTPGASPLVVTPFANAYTPQAAPPGPRQSFPSPTYAPQAPPVAQPAPFATQPAPTAPQMAAPRPINPQGALRQPAAQSAPEAADAPRKTRRARRQHAARAAAVPAEQPAETSSPVSTEALAATPPRALTRPLPLGPQLSRVGEIRTVAGKSFRREPDGSWVDVEFRAGETRPLVEAVAGSPEYAALLDTSPALRPFLRLSDQITVVFEGTVYRVLPGER